MAAKENRSGNKNAVGGFPDRGDAAASARRRLSNTLRSLARLPYVVGADWFQYYDEPPHGRKLDGEDYNFGLVDIHDQPYAEVTAAFDALDLTAIKSAASPRQSVATHGVPPAPADPFHEFQSMRALMDWDRERGFVPPATPHPTGDFYHLLEPGPRCILATFVMDIVEPDYYRDRDVPESDRAAWTIRVNGGEPITARIGSGKPPVSATRRSVCSRSAAPPTTCGASPPSSCRQRNSAGKSSNPATRSRWTRATRPTDVRTGSSGKANLFSVSEIVVMS